MAPGPNVIGLQPPGITNPQTRSTDNKINKHIFNMDLKPDKKNGKVSEYTVDKLERRCEVKRPQGAQWW